MLFRSYRVAAYNPAGQGTTFSNTGTATPYGTPGAVTGLTATPGAKQVTLSWSAPTGTATGGSPITGYEFSYTDISGNSSTPIVITTNTYTQNGLQPGATYKFKIRAINGYGYAVEPAGVATVQSGPFSSIGGFGASAADAKVTLSDRKSTRLNSSHSQQSRMPSSA